MVTHATDSRSVPTRNGQGHKGKDLSRHKTMLKLKVAWCQCYFILKANCVIEEEAVFSTHFGDGWGLLRELSRSCVCSWARCFLKQDKKGGGTGEIDSLSSCVQLLNELWLTHPLQRDKECVLGPEGASVGFTGRLGGVKTRAGKPWTTDTCWG